eukprot:6439656-Heterocapsa_arctica.AAC.1
MKWFFIDGLGTGVTFESLADSGGERFMSLDLKLSTSLGKIVKTGPPALASKLMAKEHQFAETGKMMMGRQIAYMIY